MFCSKCGNKLENEVTFCGNCGAKVNIFSTKATQDKEEGVSNIPVYIFFISLALSILGSALEDATQQSMDLMFSIAGLGMVISSVWYLTSCRKKKCGVVVKVIMILVLIVIVASMTSVVLAIFSATGDKEIEQQGVSEQQSDEYPKKTDIGHEEISLSSIKKSVVNIVCESTIDGELSGGSGTMMTVDGTILTASHIFPQDEDTVYVDPDEGCLVMLPNEYTGGTEEIYWAEPIIIPGLSDLYDVAFMNITSAYVDEDGIAFGTYPKTFHSFWNSDEYGEICTDDKLDINLGDKITDFFTTLEIYLD